MTANKQISCPALAFASAFFCLLSPLSAQLIDPDPDIFDANTNGAGLNGQSPSNSSNSALGGSVRVVNESDLPPLNQGMDVSISTNGGPMGRMGRSGSQSGITTSSSGGMRIPMGGGSGGQEQSNNNPLQRPPQGSQSQSSSQQNSRGRPPPGAQQSASQQSQGSEMPEGMKPNNKTGEGDPMQGKLPEPPPESEIGDPAMQIDPNGQLADETGEEGEASAEASSASSQSKNRSKRAGQSEAGEQSESSDNQEMPEDMGNGRGSSSRGKGTVDDVAVPSNI